ncbi:MAG: hypothetical protein H0X12_07595 [Nocardioides sp.]|nr:hypothetical protein [Nocardioides sp.]
MRFVLRSKTGELLWSDAVDVQNAVAVARLPEGVLESGHDYSITPTYTRSLGDWEREGDVYQFVFDPLGPTVPAPACTGDCISATVELFSGVVPAGASQTLDVGSVVSDPNNWVERASLKVATLGGRASLQFPSARGGQASALPTFVLDNDKESTVEVWPAGLNTITMTNAGNSPARVSVTLTGWVPGLRGYAEERDAEVDAAADALTDEDLLPDLSGVKETDIQWPQDPICHSNEDIESCVEFGSPGASQSEPHNLATERRVSRLSDASACDGPETTTWLLVNRFRACRVGGIIKLVTFPFDPTSVSYIKVRSFERLVLHPKDDLIEYKVAFERTGGLGRLTGAPLRFKSHLRCDTRVCTHSETEEDELVVSALQPESGWSTQSVQSVVDVGDDPILSATTDLRPQWKIDLRDIPDLAATVNLDTPEFRCDAAPELRYYSVGDQRPVTEGCVFPFAEIPAMQLPSSRYPNHGTLVKRGQRVISGSPGKSSGNMPLTRTPRLAANARKASQMCVTAGVQMTCDEYSYAATQEGCGWSGWKGLPGPPCVVADMTSRENSGAGGYLMAFLRRQRTMYGDHYFVTVS